MKYSDEQAFDKANMFGKGVPNSNFTQYFTGNSFLNIITEHPGNGIPFAANVTFEPGCRNHWHIHHAKNGGGQILICTAGEGWYQEEGKPAQSLSEGSYVFIPAGVKHWHGAKRDSWFSHISIEVPGRDTENEWLEEVSDDQYPDL